MDTVALVASVVLGIAFVVAGASKIAAGRVGRTSPWARRPVVGDPLVPWIELAVGAALIAQVGAPWPSLAHCCCSSLLGVDRGTLRQGQRPPCVFRSVVGEADRRRAPRPQRRLMVLALLSLL